MRWRRVIGIALGVGALAVAVFFLVRPSAAPTTQDITGGWVWEEGARADEPQTRFTLFIDREGDVVTGVYSVDVLINDEWQGEDGNKTPFRGRMTKSGAEIEFDPQATVPGYEENPPYRSASDGRPPSVATLTFRDGALLWRFVSGSELEAVPAAGPVDAQVTLRRRELPR